MSYLQSLLSESDKFDKSVSEQISKEKNGKSYSDDRYWSLTVDKKTQNGYAEIRFLPAKEGETSPYVTMYDHGFQNKSGYEHNGRVYWPSTGEWYIEKSLSTIGKPDPVGELNSALWKGLGEFAAIPEKDRQDLARNMKRRTNYVSNILILNDPEHPENNGKVFLFKFGSEIFSKLIEVMEEKGKMPGDVYVRNVFSLISGADFRIRSSSRTDKGGFRSYEKSTFLQPSSLLDRFKESQLEEILSSQYSLSELTDSKNFKTYAELSLKLAKVMGRTFTFGNVQVMETPPMFTAPQIQTGSVQHQSFSNEMTINSSSSTSKSFDPENDGEDIMKLFQKLSEERKNSPSGEA